MLVTLVKAQLMSLLPQAFKVSFWFNAKLSKRVRHAEEKKKEKKRKAIRPLNEEKKKEKKRTAIRPLNVIERETH